MATANGWGEINPDYIDAVESSPGATDLTGLQSCVAQACNNIGKGYLDQTGAKLIITGAAEKGYHHKSSSGFGHEDGWKVDISTSDSNGGMNEQLLGQLIDQNGGAAAKEDAGHYDVAFGATGAGYGVNLITQNTQGTLSSGGGGGGNAQKMNELGKKVQAMIDWCVKTSQDDNIGYSMGAGGPDNYDCTGFISAGANAAGFNIEVCHGDAFDSSFQANGWEMISYDDSQGTSPLKAGDILDNDHHVELYIGNDQVVGAHSAHKPKADQVSVEGWYGDGWTGILRCTGAEGMGGPGNGGPSGPATAKDHTFKVTGNTVEIMPANKTFAEPVYPDYIYVAGNIPNSVIEQKAVDNTDKMDKVTDSNSNNPLNGSDTKKTDATSAQTTADTAKQSGTQTTTPSTQKTDNDSKTQTSNPSQSKAKKAAPMSQANQSPAATQNTEGQNKDSSAQPSDDASKQQNGDTTDQSQTTTDDANTPVSNVNNSSETPETAYSLMTNDTMKDLTGLDVGGFTTDKMQKFAQKAYDPSKAILERKVPSAGKPLNNNDSYPVDLKLEELENHLPRIKHYKVNYKNGLEMAKMMLEISDYAEKRVVKLENVLATMMRYIFGIGSRMFVNCQYYGGQDHRSKYQCIRCMQDNRSDDGQVMTLDQCLSCSRYEPIIGQTYDILNDVGANLAAIQDDIQAGYMNMEDYLDFTRVERMHKKKTEYKMPVKNVKTRDKNEKDFKDVWDEGVKMDWHLVPVEVQKAQINWRADINHEDKSPDKLASNQLMNGLGGSGVTAGCTLQAGNYKEWMLKHHDNLEKMQQSGGEHTKHGIQAGFDYMSAEKVSEAIQNMQSQGYEQTLQDVCQQNGVDPVLLFSFAIEESTGNPKAPVTEGGCGGMFQCSGVTPDTPIKDQVQKACELFKGKVDAVGKGDNPIAPIQAYCSWYEELDAVNKEDAMYDDAWAEACYANNEGNAEVRLRLFPAICSAYIQIMDSNTGLSQLTDKVSEGAEFPLVTAKLNDTYFVQDFGVTNTEQGSGVCAVSNVLGFKCPAGSELHAPFDGTASKGSDDSIGNYVKIKNSNGDIITFGKCSSVEIDEGTSVKKGGVIAVSTDALTIQYQNSTGSYQDPKSQWPKMKNNMVSTSTSIGKFLERSSES